MEFIGPVKRDVIRVSSFVEICHYFEGSFISVNSVEGHVHVCWVTGVDQGSIGEGVVELGHIETGIGEIDQAVLGGTVEIGDVVTHGEGITLGGHVDLNLAG